MHISKYFWRSHGHLTVINLRLILSHVSYCLNWASIANYWLHEALPQFLLKSTIFCARASVGKEKWMLVFVFLVEVSYEVLVITRNWVLFLRLLPLVNNTSHCFEFVNTYYHSGLILIFNFRWYVQYDRATFWSCSCWRWWMLEVLLFHSNLYYFHHNFSAPLWTDGISGLSSRISTTSSICWTKIEMFIKDQFYNQATTKIYLINKKSADYPSLSA